MGSLDVRRAASVSPRCLQMCPQLCKPIGAFLATYKASGDDKAVKARACDYTTDLDCAFEAAAFPECHYLVSRFIGSTSRAAWGDFKQICSLPCPSASLEVRRVASISPECLQSCPQLCSPIGAFMATYKKSGD